MIRLSGWRTFRFDFIRIARTSITICSALSIRRSSSASMTPRPPPGAAQGGPSLLLRAGDAVRDSGTVPRPGTAQTVPSVSRRRSGTRRGSDRPPSCRCPISLFQNRRRFLRTYQFESWSMVNSLTLRAAFVTSYASIASMYRTSSEFSSEMIQRSISGRCASGIVGLLVPEPVDVRVQCEERVGVHQRPEEFPLHLGQPVFIEHRRPPRRTGGHEIPARGVGAVRSRARQTGRRCSPSTWTSSVRLCRGSARSPSPFGYAGWSKRNVPIA